MQLVGPGMQGMCQRVPGFILSLGLQFLIFRADFSQPACGSHVVMWLKIHTVQPSFGAACADICKSFQSVILVLRWRLEFRRSFQTAWVFDRWATPDTASQPFYACSLGLHTQSIAVLIPRHRCDRPLLFCLQAPGPESCHELQPVKAHCPLQPGAQLACVADWLHANSPLAVVASIFLCNFCKLTGSSAGCIGGADV